MKFALFYEIPVARPWTPGKEHQAYKDTLEQAVLGDQMGFHAFWTVEHHFLEEYSHCSNPEVLYGAVAARTKNIRIGYGVRLLPKPYNHPIRTAESVAVLDLVSDGRVDFGTGRSSTRAELEGFDVDPDETRAHVARGPAATSSARGPRTSTRRRASTGRWARPAGCCRSRCSSRTRRSSVPPAASPATRRSASAASGSARSPSACRPSSWPRTSRCTARVSRRATQPAGKFVNETAATFTMVLCAPTNEEATEVARGVVRVVPEARRRPHRVGRRVAGGARHHRRRSSARTSTQVKR